MVDDVEVRGRRGGEYVDGERDLLLICQTYNALYLPPHPIKEDVGG